MEKMMGVKKMEGAVGSSSFPSSGCSNSFSSVFDFSEEADEKGSLVGFMELLGSQDYYSTPPLLDSPQVCVAHDNNNSDDPAKGAGKECSEVSNNQQQQQQPPTPNSSSISSASSEAVHEHENKTTQDQASEHQKTNKQLKAKKTNQKRQQKEPRFAFMTKSEVDHLEDGYRWRKYGQKAVKNSSFPRSYYRCTSASCNVKKRVERSFNDPSVVVTTYEGQHTHLSPVMARSSCLAGSPIPPGISATATAAGFGPLMPESYLSQYYQRQHNQQLLLSSLGFPSSFSISQERPQLCNPAGTNALILRDHGLLQDVVPSHMLKEEE